MATKKKQTHHKNQVRRLKETLRVKHLLEKGMRKTQKKKRTQKANRLVDLLLVKQKVKEHLEKLNKELTL
jgi:hypothetical protein